METCEVTFRGTEIKIEFGRSPEDGLSRQVWEFRLKSLASDRPVLELDRYAEAARNTRRHGFIVGKHWWRLEQRSSNMKRDEVPMPIEVLTQVRVSLADAVGRIPFEDGR